MKRVVFGVLFAASLFAGSYVTLDNGKTIYLKDDGTWEEVKVIKKGDKNIALKKDGTWEEIAPQKVESAKVLDNSLDQQYKESSLGKALLGKWAARDGSEYLEFTPTEATLKIRQKTGFRTYTGKWRIERIDEKEKEVVVNIAEGARLGFLTFGGVIRKLRFGDDMNTLIDESDKLSQMKVYVLHRVR